MTAAPEILVCALNWLGDSCMALPALARYRDAHPDVSLTVLAKPQLHAFWRMVPSVARIIPLHGGVGGLLQVRRELQAHPCRQAVVLPNSWRSALAPWVAGVPRRIGASRGLRDLLLTERVRAAVFQDPARHQQLEYEVLFGLGPDTTARPSGACLLEIPADAEAISAGTLSGGGQWVGMLPGAARGVSKQWPPERFTEVARQLQAEDGIRVCLLGTDGEAALCRAIASAAAGVLNLAGRTALPELAALLRRCDCVVCNDSGGMHLAAVCGTPVAAVFGLTDPAKTGPVGSGHRILMAPGIPRQRDIARASAAAAAALAAVPVDAVVDAVRVLLGGRFELAGY